jgi:hypothetical protein
MPESARHHVSSAVRRRSPIDLRSSASLPAIRGYGNCFLLLGAALFFFLVPGTTLLSDLRDPALRGEGIPRAPSPQRLRSRSRSPSEPFRCGEPGFWAAMTVSTVDLSNNVLDVFPVFDEHGRADPKNMEMQGSMWEIRNTALARVHQYGRVFGPEEGCPKARARRCRFGLAFLSPCCGGGRRVHSQPGVRGSTDSQV